MSLRHPVPTHPQSPDTHPVTSLTTPIPLSLAIDSTPNPATKTSPTPKNIHTHVQTFKHTHTHTTITIFSDFLLYESCDGIGTGWRRLIGCLQLQVIFRKRATDYRALLRKMTCNLRHPMSLRHPAHTLHMDITTSYIYFLHTFWDSYIWTF